MRPPCHGPAGRHRWSELAGPAVQDRFAELLAASPFVTAEPELTAPEFGAVPARRVDAHSGRAARRRVDPRGPLRFQPGATHVYTSSAEARAAGKGVCQDFAHVTLALLRAVGLPARYVSGYLHPAAEAGIGETTTGESHAWVEFWAGNRVAADPTSVAEVGSRHVLLARGRDYADVRPLSGVYSGPAAEHFGVTVEVTRLG